MKSRLEKKKQPETTMIQNIFPVPSVSVYNKWTPEKLKKNHTFLNAMFFFFSFVSQEIIPNSGNIILDFLLPKLMTKLLLNAWCRIGVDKPIRWLSKRNSSTKTEPKKPNQYSVHWSVLSLKLFVCLKCVTRLYPVQWERWHVHVMSC